MLLLIVCWQKGGLWLVSHKFWITSDWVTLLLAAGLQNYSVLNLGDFSRHSNVPRELRESNMLTGQQISVGLLVLNWLVDDWLNLIEIPIIPHEAINKFQMMMPQISVTLSCLGLFVDVCTVSRHQRSRTLPCPAAHGPICLPSLPDHEPICLPSLVPGLSDDALNCWRMPCHKCGRGFQRLFRNSLEASTLR